MQVFCSQDLFYEDITLLLFLLAPNHFIGVLIPNFQHFVFGVCTCDTHFLELLGGSIVQVAFLIYSEEY